MRTRIAGRGQSRCWPYVFPLNHWIYLNQYSQVIISFEIVSCLRLVLYPIFSQPTTRGAARIDFSTLLGFNFWTPPVLALSDLPTPAGSHRKECCKDWFQYLTGLSFWIPPVLALSDLPTPVWVLPKPTTRGAARIDFSILLGFHLNPTSAGSFWPPHPRWVPHRKGCCKDWFQYLAGLSFWTPPVLTLSDLPPPLGFVCSYFIPPCLLDIPQRSTAR